MIYFEEALRVLVANPIRTLLTIVGLVIGVGAVISIQVLGHSMAGAFSETLGSLADNSFTVFPGSFQKDFEKTAIRLGDLQKIIDTVPNVDGATPVILAQQLFRNGHNLGRFYMSADTYPPFNNTPLAYGRSINPDDISRADDVAVLTWKAYNRLFPSGGDPTGTSIYGGPRRYIVIGVKSAPRQGALNATFGGDVSIPWTTEVREYLHGDRLLAARFTVKDASQLPQTETAVIEKIRELRQVDPEVRYQAFDKAQFTQGIDGLFTAVTIVVALIGFVSLVVAGIGVMNIMLVSVTERTKEIGTRKAIGATRGQILAQFFIESVLLSGIGCFTGMAIGLGIGGFVNSFYIVKITGYTAALPYGQAVMITAIFASFVALVFGTYPAYRAAALDPIEALRYE